MPKPCLDGSARVDLHLGGRKHGWLRKVRYRTAKQGGAPACQKLTLSCRVDVHVGLGGRREAMGRPGVRPSPPLYAS